MLVGGGQLVGVWKTDIEDRVPSQFWDLSINAEVLGEFALTYADVADIEASGYAEAIGNVSNNDRD